MLSKYDYLVIGFYFVFMAMIGWVCRKFIGNTSDYFRGGGKMLWWMAGCSAFVAQFSAWTFTARPARRIWMGRSLWCCILPMRWGFSATSFFLRRVSGRCA